MVVVKVARLECTCSFKLQVRCWLLAGASPALEVNPVEKPRWKHEQKFSGRRLFALQFAVSVSEGVLCLLYSHKHIHLCLAE